MPTLRSWPWRRVLTFVSALLILKTTVGIVLRYGDYIPPDFTADFLRDREFYFFGSYQWAFYSHLAAGPVSLVLGLVLLNQRFRERFPQWHRRMGRVQAMCVLLVVAPSGLVMAWYAQAGPIAGTGFIVLAILTAISMAMGWRTAVRKRFVEHRLWMWRAFLLLCSAVVIRVIGGLTTVLSIHATWIDVSAAWVSWLVPLTVFELRRLRSWQRKPGLPTVPVDGWKLPAPPEIVR